MRRSLSAMLVATLLLGVYAVGASATSGLPRVYQGAFGDAGGKIKFKLVRHQGRPFASAQFMQDEQVQTCATGELNWSVDRTVPAGPGDPVRHPDLGAAHGHARRDPDHPVTVRVARGFRPRSVRG